MEMYVPLIVAQRLADELVKARLTPEEQRAALKITKELVRVDLRGLCRLSATSFGDEPNPTLDTLDSDIQDDPCPSQPQSHDS